MVYQGSSIHWLYARLIAPNDQELRLPGKIDSLSTAWGKLYKTSLIKEHGLRFVPVRQIGTEDLLFNVYYFTWVKKAIYLPDLFYHYRKNNITSLTKLYKPHLTEQWNLLFRLIEDKELRKEMGKAARLKAEQYDIKNIIPMWMELFNQLINEKRK